MTETFETAYYKELTDDLTVAREHLHAKTEALQARLTQADALISEYLQLLEDGRPVEDVVVRMHRHTNQ
jgi:hypothetical protein